MQLPNAPKTNVPYFDLCLSLHNNGPGSKSNVSINLISLHLSQKHRMMTQNFFPLLTRRIAGACVALVESYFKYGLIGALFHAVISPVLMHSCVAYFGL